MAGNNNQSTVNPITQQDLETGTTTRVPKLKGAEDYGTWKNRMRSFFYVTDFTQWNSIQLGPHIPMRTTATGEEFNPDPTTYTDVDKQLLQRDHKAYGALTMALSNDVYNMFEEYGTAHDLWFALNEYYEGNEEMPQ
jgi:hypothetical protein